MTYWATERVYVLYLLIFIFGIANQLHAQVEEASGYVSYYADRFHGKKTASGDLYDKNAFTAAHRTLPFGTMVKVTRTDNKKSVVVRINDRGPFVKGRIIDLSRAAARKLEIVQSGSVIVNIDVIDLGEPNVQRPPVQKTSMRDVRANSLSKSSLPSASQKKGLYYLSAATATSAGYGIQLAAYKEFQNVLDAVADLRAQRHKDTMVHISQGANGNPVYRLIIGAFTNRQDAVLYQKKLSRNKGIIIELSKLQ